MQQALIANSSRHGVNQITQNEFKTHGAILNVLKQTAASIGGGIVSGRVVDFEHEYDGEHVLSLDEFAALITHEPDLKTQYKLMESMNSDIRLMKTKRLLAEIKAEEQMIARRTRAAAAPDAPVRPSSPASLAAGQGQGGGKGLTLTQLVLTLPRTTGSQTHIARPPRPCALARGARRAAPQYQLTTASTTRR
jgi:hypothetical protein